MLLFFKPRDGFGMENLNQTFFGEYIFSQLREIEYTSQYSEQGFRYTTKERFFFRESVQTSSVAYPSSYSVIYWDLYLRCKATGRGDHSPVQMLMLKTTGAHLHSPNTLLNPLNAELNPICHLLALLGSHRILHVSGVRVN
jgi:hypothetical protein